MVTTCGLSKFLGTQIFFDLVFDLQVIEGLLIEFIVYIYCYYM